MQIILVGAAIVSLAIKEWSTGVAAARDHRAQRRGRPASGGQGRERDERAEGDGEGDRARPARRRPRREIAAEEVVVGDVVLLAAGDEVPADGRIIEASALQIDESALTGESVPASKGAETLAGAELAPGDQTNMAFMHTPVTHGSGDHDRDRDRQRHRRSGRSPACCDGTDAASRRR